MCVSDEVPSAAMPPQALQLEPRRVSIEWTHSDDLLSRAIEDMVYNVLINSIRWSMCDIVKICHAAVMMEDKVYQCERKCKERFVFILDSHRCVHCRP